MILICWLICCLCCIVWLMIFSIVLILWRFRFIVGLMRCLCCLIGMICVCVLWKCCWFVIICCCWCLMWMRLSVFCVMWWCVSIWSVFRCCCLIMRFVLSDRWVMCCVLDCWVKGCFWLLRNIMWRFIGCLCELRCFCWICLLIWWWWWLDLVGCCCCCCLCSCLVVFVLLDWILVRNCLGLVSGLLIICVYWILCVIGVWWLRWFMWMV